jgi:pimeloyl-ACP methyl ester carboxylesterase
MTAAVSETALVHPETRYTRSGDVSIAYQVVGQGTFDLVFVPPFVTHVERWWDLPSFAPTLERYASFSRLILFDKRGTGMSDRATGAPSLETRMDDLRAVLDAAASSRAAMFASSEGAAMAILYAATYPTRTAALVLRSAYPRTMWAPDFPWGRTEERFRLETERQLAIFGPRAQAEEAVQLLGRFSEAEAAQMVDYWRQSASPGAVEALALMNKQIDVRHVLAAIRVPTLLLHGTEDEVVPVEVARYMAERIPGAQLVEIPGAGHLAVGPSSASISAEVERFLSGLWESGGWDEPESERVLSTVLFTDIVGSSERAVEVGDRAWRDLLAQHHAVIRRELSRFRGRELDTAGDGFFASFDGPARAIRCAQTIVDSVRRLGLEVRVGLHTGECEIVDGKMVGVAVHTGARLASIGARCSCRAPSGISSRARGSRSRIAASTISRASANGTSTHSFPETRPNRATPSSSGSFRDTGPNQRPTASGPPPPRGRAVVAGGV